MNSPTCQTRTPLLPILSMSDIPLISIPQSGVHLSCSLSIPTTKCEIVPPVAHPVINLARENRLKSTTEADVRRGYSALQGKGEPPKTTPEAANNDMGALGNTGEYDSKDNTNHCGGESNQDVSRENTGDSDLELASGDLHTKEGAIRTA